MAVDATLLHRLTVMRGLSALELTPDIIRPTDFPGLRALEEHSITGGISFGPLYDVLLTTFVPGALGFVFDLVPHALVLLYGFNGNLSLPWPPTPASLYQPHVQEEYGFGFLDGAFFEEVGANEATSSSDNDPKKLAEESKFAAASILNLYSSRLVRGHS